MELNDLHKVIHDIKQPIANIRASASIICNATGEETIDADAIRKYCAIVQRSCNTVNLLINNLGDIANCKNSLITVHYTSLYISEYIDLYKMAVRPIVESTNTLFKTNVTCKDKTFACDYELLTRILNNLVTNAIKYNTSVQKEVDLEVDIVEDNLIINITDNGIGIPKDEIDKVTQCNYRASNGMNCAEGCGLGMAIVKEFVQLLKGTLDIKSKLGKGTKITLKLPQGDITSLNSPDSIKQLDSERMLMEFSLFFYSNSNIPV